LCVSPYVFISKIFYGRMTAPFGASTVARMLRKL
jgi:hypothetical protein